MSNGIIVIFWAIGLPLILGGWLRLALGNYNLLISILALGIGTLMIILGLIAEDKIDKQIFAR